eukprot:scaffold138948_cov31-Tisochrysis_lutea.AAC.1
MERPKGPKLANRLKSKPMVAIIAAQKVLLTHTDAPNCGPSEDSLRGAYHGRVRAREEECVLAQLIVPARARRHLEPRSQARRRLARPGRISLELCHELAPLRSRLLDGAEAVHSGIEGGGVCHSALGRTRCRVVNREAVEHVDLRAQCGRTELHRGHQGTNISRNRVECARVHNQNARSLGSVRVLECAPVDELGLTAQVSIVGLRCGCTQVSGQDARSREKASCPVTEGPSSPPGRARRACACAETRAGSRPPRCQPDAHLLLDARLDDGFSVEAVGPSGIEHKPASVAHGPQGTLVSYISQEKS